VSGKGYGKVSDSRVGVGSDLLPSLGAKVKGEEISRRQSNGSNYEKSRQNREKKTTEIKVEQNK